MSSIRGGGGYPSREGLFSRPSQTDQAQISIEMGQPFDLDSEVDGLTGQVSRLKTLARAIGQETEENRKITESLEDVMENTKLAMKKGMKRLNRAFAQSNSSHLIYLALFVVGLFCLVIFWTRVVRLVRMFV